MVKIILQKINMQHFSMKWFDILNLQLVSIILPSKDIKNYFGCFSFRTINHKARTKQMTGSLSKWPKTLLTLHSLSFLFLCMYSISEVHLSLWQIIKHLFQTSVQFTLHPQHEASCDSEIQTKKDFKSNFWKQLGSSPTTSLNSEGKE